MTTPDQTAADRLAELDRQWNSVNQQIEELDAGAWHVGNLHDAKGRLLEQLDELEYEIANAQREVGAGE